MHMLLCDCTYSKVLIQKYLLWTYLEAVHAGYPSVQGGQHGVRLRHQLPAVRLQQHAHLQP